MLIRTDVTSGSNSTYGSILFDLHAFLQCMQNVWSFFVQLHMVTARQFTELLRVWKDERMNRVCFYLFQLLFMFWISELSISNEILVLWLPLKSKTNRSVMGKENGQKVFKGCFRYYQQLSRVHTVNWPVTSLKINHSSLF